MPYGIKLQAQDVHIWTMTLEQPEAVIKELQCHLSAEEVLRAERFYFERDRERFIVGRGFLRQILSSYLSVAPKSLVFGYEKQGKPYLELSHGAPSLSFNLSHSNEKALCVVSLQRQVGVDIEYVRPVSDLEKISRRFFTAQEHAVILDRPQSEQPESFFLHWTAKEACMKALGTGMHIPLSDVELTQSPAEGGWKETVTIRNKDYPSQWNITRISISAEYIAALATRELDLTLSYQTAELK